MVVAIDRDAGGDGGTGSLSRLRGELTYGGPDVVLSTAGGTPKIAIRVEGEPPTVAYFSVRPHQEPPKGMLRKLWDYLAMK